MGRRTVAQFTHQIKGGRANASGHSELSRRVARPRDTERDESQVECSAQGAFSEPPRHRPARCTRPPQL